jgi:hypothetical protein
MSDVSQESNLMSPQRCEFQIRFNRVAEALVPWHQRQGQKWVDINKSREETWFADMVLCKISYQLENFL